MKKNKLLIHLILFFTTAGIGNIIYYLICKNNKPKIKVTYIYNPDVKQLIDDNALIALEREAKIRKSTGRTLVKITTHGGSCDDCKTYEGKILNDDVFSPCIVDYRYPLLSDAIRDGLFHSGCRHGLTTYYSKI